MWASFSTRPRRYSGHGFSYVVADLGDVSEGEVGWDVAEGEGWVDPRPVPPPADAMAIKAALKAGLDRIAAEILEEEKWSRVEDHIDRQVALNFPGKSRPAPATAKHVCPVPDPVEEDQFTKTWECPECKQRWQKPAWYSAYQPVSE